jgi:hypothetical protein
MLTKITDDLYIDLDMLVSLVKNGDNYFFSMRDGNWDIAMSEERFLAIKNKIDELSQRPRDNLAPTFVKIESEE